MENTAKENAMISFSAVPLEKFSSLNKIPVLSLIGIKSSSPCISVIFNFNLQTNLKDPPSSQFTFHMRNADAPPIETNPDFCISNLTRWSLDISPYTSFMHYLQKMNRKHYKRYNETQTAFTKYGAKLSFIEGDWSQYADDVYKLYINVAQKHGAQLYDLNFFRLAAKDSHYKLMCIWYKLKLIAALIVIDEQPIFHSMCCGLDYEHSKKCLAYSQMHYEFIRIAIDSKKYKIADIGPTANDAKSMLGFEPVSSCLDVWAHNRLIRGFLRLSSRFVTATINSEAKLKLNFHLPYKKEESNIKTNQ